jgi:diguanylate cyclase (GGDEF)-like protein
MTTENNSTPRSPPKPPLLKKVLKKNQGVRKRIEDCAAELSTVNETVKKEMEAGITLQQAKKALAQSERVEEKVQDCADELDEINKVLAQEVDDRNKRNHQFMEICEKLSVAESIAEEANQRSFQDALTGIPNRALFNIRIEQAIALARRNNWFLAVMFIDLDRFKLINDTYGHAVGDKVLQTVAQRLHRRVRSEDTLCRYGGDEFLYLLVNPQSLENVQRVAEEVSEHIAQPVIIDDLELIVEPSIGIAIYPNDGNTYGELVANADAAMYRAKKTRASYTFDSVKDDSNRV